MSSVVEIIAADAPLENKLLEGPTSPQMAEDLTRRACPIFVGVGLEGIDKVQLAINVLVNNIGAGRKLPL